LTTSLSNILDKVHKVPNKQNKALLEEFYHFLKNRGTTDRHQANTLKAILAFMAFLGAEVSLRDMTKQRIMAFLDTKVKSQEQDPEKKWITTWNDYMLRVKHFYRWLHNAQGLEEPKPDSEWTNPDCATFKKKKTKRLSPYSQNEIWERDELLAIIKYDTQIRNKAALALFWDLDARNHEITMLKIKNIRLREKYGEGEIPHEAKTGSGPILLTMSFPYVRDWLNIHPLKNEPEARLICNLYTGLPVRPEATWTMLKLLRRRILRLLDKGEIQDAVERKRLEYLLRTKKWNPYCLRHSAITHDSDYLPGYALNKKVRWSMNSKQPARYIKNRMGETLKNVILEHNGIQSEDSKKAAPVLRNCPRCFVTNALETKYCGKCSYPLTQEAYEDSRTQEEKLILELQEKLAQMKEDNEKRYLQVMALIRLNPLLSNVKPEELVRIATERGAESFES
jgi:integrase/recombinase XerD